MKKNKNIQKATEFSMSFPDHWEVSSAPNVDTSMNTVRIMNYQ
jgi:hypothetical protein